MVHVKQLQYLGSIIQENGRCGKDVKMRVGRVKVAFTNNKGRCGKDVKMRVGRVKVAFTNNKASSSRYGRSMTNEYDLTASKESVTQVDTRRNV